jgi:uncharacterized protein YijF (DUF1287 family)
MSPAGKGKFRVIAVILLFTAAAGAVVFRSRAVALPEAKVPERTAVFRYDGTFSEKLVQAASERTRHSVTYDGSYMRIGYPNGDVPDNTGVCSDVVIRVYRKVGIDLQKELHEDMLGNFGQYPDKWGLKKPDRNIDHRRVPNLKVFFKRHGLELPVTMNRHYYLPGDLVTWTVAGSLPHIGIVSDRQTITGRPLIVHNIGRGPVMEDMLFDYPITGHYRYYGDTSVISER